VRLVLDLGDAEAQERLDLHLSQRGLSVDDVVAAAEFLVPRRKGDRLYGYGRGAGDRPIVVVLRRVRRRWRPLTAWQMDEIEERWWRRHGGR
jgi:hypothetical protein